MLLEVVTLNELDINKDDNLRIIVKTLSSYQKEKAKNPSLMLEDKYLQDMYHAMFTYIGNCFNWTVYPKQCHRSIDMGMTCNSKTDIEIAIHDYIFMVVEVNF